MNTLTCFHLQTFVSPKPGSGAKTTVCVLQKSISVTQMKSIAGKMDSQETGFLIVNEKAKVYPLRWFMNNQEVQFCGTGLLGAGFVLEQAFPQEKKWKVKTRYHNTISIFKNRSCLAFTSKVDKPVEGKPPEAIKKSTKNHPGLFYKSQYDWLIELNNKKEVKEFKPNMKQLKKWSNKNNRGLIVTAKTNKGCVSRFFAPNLGPCENFTGSIHRVLAPYWQFPVKGPILAKQLSEQGEGMAYCSCKRDNVTISGKVKLVKKSAIAVE